MKQRLFSSLLVVLFLSGCSEQSEEQARYARESMQILDKDCVKQALEDQMQQAADYSAARLNALRDDSMTPKNSGTGNAEISGGILDNCTKDVGSGR
ncbi:MAG: hypothetical protein P8Y83_08905 [Gammaproteobacteria bacterium]|jgi:hypothetical protein